MKLVVFAFYHCEFFKCLQASLRIPPKLSTDFSIYFYFKRLTGLRNDRNHISNKKA